VNNLVGQGDDTQQGRDGMDDFKNTDTQEGGGGVDDFRDTEFGGGSGGSNGAPCDIFNQDCPILPVHLKCTVDDIWDDIPRCRPVTDNPDQVGVPCSELGDNDGDSCDVDGLCLDGLCREMHIDGVSCNHNEISHMYTSGVRLCEEKCDPLYAGECGSGKHCTSTDSSPDGIFSCYVTDNLNLGSFGKGCVSSHQCQEGAICLQSNTVPNGYCDNGLTHCCVPLCDIDQGDSFCHSETGASTCCMTIYNNSTPPGLEHIGACVLSF